MKHGLVRVLHPESYVDDPTRILRAVRYEMRYGFQITPEDLRLIAAAKSHLGGLSGERLRHELDLILVEEKSAQMMQRLKELDILSNIQPLLDWDATKADYLAKINQPQPDSWQDVPDLLHVPRRVGLSYLVWLGSLQPSAIQELALRLDFKASLREALLAFSSLYRDLPGLIESKASEIVGRLETLPPLVICAGMLAAEPPARAIMDNYLARWRHIKPKTTGDDLIQRGLPPGPTYKKILNGLRMAWLDGEIRTNEEEMLLLEKLVMEFKTLE